MILIVSKDSRYRIEAGTSVALTALHITKSARKPVQKEETAMNSGGVEMRPTHAESFTRCGGLKHQRDMNMSRYISKVVLLLTLSLVICCGLYLLSLWVIGQSLFPFQANSSTLTGPDSKVVGSRQIAQPFTKDEYFQPGPSTAAYDASVSASSAVAASNNFSQQQNRDFGVADVPQNPAGKVCHFYGC